MIDIKAFLFLLVYISNKRKLSKIGCTNCKKGPKKWVCKTLNFLICGSYIGCTNAHPFALGSATPGTSLHQETFKLKSAVIHRGYGQSMVVQNHVKTH